MLRSKLMFLISTLNSIATSIFRFSNITGPKSWDYFYNPCSVVTINQQCKDVYVSSYYN